MLGSTAFAVKQISLSPSNRSSPSTHTMDFLKKFTDNKESDNGGGDHQKQDEGGLMGMINGAMGGGKKSEHKEDLLDKAVDLVQEHVFKQGNQSNESAIEQAKDEAISDAIRDQYKKMTGKEFMIPDKS
ncbi:hypothetical protein CCMSSC00406_0007100 [Pleurotus cornucopiae]|uniref:Uncharacterized protein n=1 Tax=Pleurotus cornucopiae TaxID=5321 RepID=A0ACB7IQ11_PLECO|nr:hypothetical protein CCMSSC00406_0007100 [Pleurotus cornucopiae]